MNAQMAEQGGERVADDSKRNEAVGCEADGSLMTDNSPRRSTGAHIR